MTLDQADKICEFIEQHYDYVSQESWFDFCELVLKTVCDDANNGGYALPLKKVHPYLFD